MPPWEVSGPKHDEGAFNVVEKPDSGFVLYVACCSDPEWIVQSLNNAHRKAEMFDRVVKFAKAACIAFGSDQEGAAIRQLAQVLLEVQG